MAEKTRDLILDFIGERPMLKVLSSTLSCHEYLVTYSEKDETFYYIEEFLSFYLVLIFGRFNNKAILFRVI